MKELPTWDYYAVLSSSLSAVQHHILCPVLEQFFSWGRTRPWNSTSFWASFIFHSFRSSWTLPSHWRRWLKFSNLFNLTGGLIIRSLMRLKFALIPSVKPVRRHSSGTRYTYSGFPDLHSLAFVRLISSGWSKSFSHGISEDNNLRKRFLSHFLSSPSLPLPLSLF